MHPRVHEAPRGLAGMPGRLPGSSDAARRKGENALECEAEAWLIQALQLFGDTSGAAARADWMVGRATALRLSGWEAIFRLLRAKTDIVGQGAYDRAIPELERLVSVDAVGHHREETYALLAVAGPCRPRDRSARAARACPRKTDRNLGAGIPLASSGGDRMARGTVARRP